MNDYKAGDEVWVRGVVEYGVDEDGECKIVFVDSEGVYESIYVAATELRRVLILGEPDTPKLATDLQPGEWGEDGAGVKYGRNEDGDIIVVAGERWSVPGTYALRDVEIVREIESPF